MGVGSSLRRLDSAVLPARWAKSPSDPVRQGAQWIYLGNVFLVIGLVLALVFGYWEALIVGLGNTLFGSVKLAAALRDRAGDA